MADPINSNNPKSSGVGAPPTHVHIEEKKGMSWLPWLLLALGVLALLWFLLKPKHDVPVTTTTTTTTDAASTAAPVTAGTGVVASTNRAMAGLGDYLKGSDAAPASFDFDTLHFDTAKSELRAEDKATVDQVAATLKGYNSVKIRLVGYADARGSEPANIALGQARANAVKAAIVAGGVDAARIETASGGDQDPAATNATAQGQAENRRTELVVVSR